MIRVEAGCCQRLYIGRFDSMTGQFGTGHFGPYGMDHTHSFKNLSPNDTLKYIWIQCISLHDEDFCISKSELRTFLAESTSVINSNSESDFIRQQIRN